MRIVQIIDSLEVGGAEKMAINYANALAKRIEFSGMIATRKEGQLKSQMNQNVDYLFLNKNKIIDFKAVLRLKKYCKKNKIEILHTHGTSYFISSLLKLIYPKIKIIWHDHNGFRNSLGFQDWMPLKIASLLFEGIIVVNFQLKNWAEKELYCNNVIYLSNFTKNEETILRKTILNGENGKRIICLANLRNPKNHFLLLEVAKKLKKSHPKWSFHLVGKDSLDDYSDKLKRIIFKNKLSGSVFLYGTKSDTANIINQCEIAVLTSKSEGLPVALLEYGLLSKAVVITAVGEIPMIIENAKNGYLVNSNDEGEFYESLKKLIEDNDRDRFGAKLYQKVKENYSEEVILSSYLQWIKIV